MKYTVALNGKNYLVEVEKGEAILVDVSEIQIAAPIAAPVAVAAAPAPAAAPVAAAPVGTGEPIKAPMPGNILGVKVAAGQAVKTGTVLFVLEAMKMENDIVAPRDGTITSVVVSQGNTVDTDAVLAYLA